MNPKALIFYYGWFHWNRKLIFYFCYCRNVPQGGSLRIYECARLKIFSRLGSVFMIETILRCCDENEKVQILDLWHSEGDHKMNHSSYWSRMTTTKMVNAWSRHRSFWARHDRVPIETYVLSYKTQNIDPVVFVMQRFIIWVWELVTRDKVRTSSRCPKSVPY